METVVIMQSNKAIKECGGNKYSAEEKFDSLLGGDKAVDRIETARAVRLIRPQHGTVLKEG